MNKKKEGEREAEAKKKELEKNQKKSSWWDRAVNLVKKAVKVITEAIDTVFTKFREAVSYIIDKAKNAAIGLINAARDWVVDKLNKFRDWAKDQVNKYLKDSFPGLAMRINGAIDTVVDTAIKGVNVVADAAIAGVEALANTLAAALDKVLQVFQTAMKAAVQIAGAVLTGDFAEALRIAIRAACDIAGIDSKPIFDFIDRAAAQAMNILKHPKKFFNNLMAAIGGGVRNFAKNIKQHLIKGLIGWLTGALSEADIKPPAKFDFRGVLSLVLQILGLTYDNIKAKIIKKFPPAAKIFSAIEKGMEFVKLLVKEGPAGLWKLIKQKLSDLKETVIAGIRNFVITTLVKEGIVWLLSLLNPAGAIAKLLKLTFDFVMFLIERFQQIKDFVMSVYNSIVAIASGALTKAMKAVEDALARSLPVVISLIASLAGLSGIGKTIKDIIGKIRKPIDKVLDWLIDKVIKFAKKLLKKGKGLAKKGKAAVKRLFNIFKVKRAFQDQSGERHSLSFKGSAKKPKLMVSSSPKGVVDLINERRPKATVAQKIHLKKADGDNAKLLAYIAKNSQNKGKRNESTEHLGPTIQTTYLKPIGDSLVKGGALAKGLPLSNITYSMSGGRASTVKAMPLTKNPGNTKGSEPAADPAGHTHLDVNAEKTTAGLRYWRRFHLINKLYHGPGLNWNLVWAAQKDNSDYEKGLETSLKKEVLKNSGMVHLQIDVSYLGMGDYTDDFPSKLKITWGHLEEKNGTLKPKGGNLTPGSFTFKHTKTQIAIDKPGKKSRIDVLFESPGEPTIKTAFGLPPALARIIAAHTGSVNAVTGMVNALNKQVSAPETVKHYLERIQTSMSVKDKHKAGILVKRRLFSQKEKKHAHKASLQAAINKLAAKSGPARTQEVQDLISKVEDYLIRLGQSLDNKGIAKVLSVSELTIQRWWSGKSVPAVDSLATAKRSFIDFKKKNRLVK